MFGPRLVAFFLALLGALGTHPALADGPLVIEGTIFSGSAFGTYAALGETIILGQSAPAFVPCVGGFDSQSLTSIDALPVLRTGTIDNSAEGTFDGSVHTSRTQSTVQSLKLLNGVITAGLVQAVSTTTREEEGYATSAEGSSFVNLRVLGLPIENTPPPNTQLGLLGFGHVILNEQTATVNANLGQLTVNMLHVFITLPNPLLEVGTEIIVGSATSRLRTAVAALGGVAFGSTANLLDLGILGRSAARPMPCGGTGGAVLENSVAAVNAPPFLTLGIVHNTAQGTVLLNSAAGELVSRVESVNVLAGLVTADLLEGRALATSDGTTEVFTTDGSFVNLSVLGFPDLEDDVPLNTQLSIPGLGKLWLNRRVLLDGRIIHRMIDVQVLEANVFGLPLGSRIEVGVTHAVIH